MNSEESGENTNIVVRSMLERRRRMRTPVIVCSLLAVVFIAYMAYKFGSPRMEEVQGPVDSARPMARPEAQDRPDAAKPVAAASATGAAHVEIVIGSVGGQLWVDGKSAAPAARSALELPPGKHLLMLQQGGRTTAQKLFLNAGDNYRVVFGPTVKVIKN